MERKITSISLTPQMLERVKQYAIKNGDLSVSAAIRAILTIFFAAKK